MILAAMNGRLRAVTQSDHAHLAAAILNLWRTDGLPVVDARDALLYATREHDNGWREYDAAPRVGQDGRPRDFRAIPGQDRRDLWTRGVLRHRAAHPHATLLITEHARSLHTEHRHDADWQPLLASWDQLRRELMDECGMSAASLDTSYHWLQLADSISLALAERWRAPRTVRGVTLHPLLAPEASEPAVASSAAMAPVITKPDALALDPFPLAGATTFTLACRFIEDRRYTDDRDLARAMAVARWQEVDVRLVPTPHH